MDTFKIHDKVIFVGKAPHYCLSKYTSYTVDNTSDNGGVHIREENVWVNENDLKLQDVEILACAKYKVIADFPMSAVSVGEELIVYKDTGMYYAVKGWDEVEYKIDVRDYPSLFEYIGDFE